MSNSPAAITITLGNRADGNTTGDKPVIVRPGEKFLVNVECVRIAGNWIASADNDTVVDVATPSGELATTIDDVRDSVVVIEIDGTDAVDGDAWRVLFDIHPTAEQTLKGEISVECEDD